MFAAAGSRVFCIADNVVFFGFPRALEPAPDLMGIDDSDDDDFNTNLAGSGGAEMEAPAKSELDQIREDAEAAVTTSSLPLGTLVIVRGR